MPKFEKSNEDIIGEKYNKLTAIEYDHTELDGKGRKLRFFKFKCDCGNEKVINYNAVKFGHTTSCGRCGYKIDLKGQKFGRLTVTEFDHKGENDNAAYWKCKCDCGNEVVVKGLYLLEGKKTSCGCVEQEEWMATTHNDPEAYWVLKVSYDCMCDRCYVPTTKHYKNYGGRGLEVAWWDFEKFYEEVLPMYQKARELYGTPNLEVDRINNNQGYEIDNIRFVPKAVNNINKSNTNYYEYFGQLWTASMIAFYLNDKLKLEGKEKFTTADIQNKLKDGWTIEMIMEIPNRHWRKVNYYYEVPVTSPIYDANYIEQIHKASQYLHPNDIDYLYNNSYNNVSPNDVEDIIETNKEKQLFPYLRELGLDYRTPREVGWWKEEDTNN